MKKIMDFLGILIVMLLGATMIRCSKHYMNKESPPSPMSHYKTTIDKCTYNIGSTFFWRTLNAKDFACPGIYQHCTEKHQGNTSECMDTHIAKSQEINSQGNHNNMNSARRLFQVYLTKTEEYIQNNYEKIPEHRKSLNELEISSIISQCSMELIDANEAIHFDTLIPCVDVRAEAYMASLKN